MEKVKSTAAQVAQRIREVIKSVAKNEGIKIPAKVTSSNFAGGNSVDVNFIDLPGPIFDTIKYACSHYKYGSFDGMTDSYNYDNVRHDIPQVSFLSFYNTPSDETKERLFKMLKEEHSTIIKSNTLKEFNNEYIPELNEYGCALIHRAFHDL